MQNQLNLFDWSERLNTPAANLRTWDELDEQQRQGVRDMFRINLRSARQYVYTVGQDGRIVCRCPVDNTDCHTL